MIAIRRRRAEKALRTEEWSRRASRRQKPGFQALALPEDMLGGAARVTVLGNARALIENHRGIADIGDECVKLMTRQGMLTVCGRELTLREVRADALSICGVIATIAFPEGGAGGA